MLKGDSLPLQGVRGREHLPAPAHQEHLQGVRGREDVPAPAPEEPLECREEADKSMPAGLEEPEPEVQVSPKFKL